MDTIKKYWKEALIVVCVIFALSKCTQSCNRASAYDNLKQETDSTIIAKDSLNKVYIDSINVLNTTIKIYEERLSGLNQALEIQDEANKRISEAKKNISVNVSTKNK